MRCSASCREMSVCSRNQTREIKSGPTPAARHLSNFSRECGLLRRARLPKKALASRLRGSKETIDIVGRDGTPCSTRRRLSRARRGVACGLYACADRCGCGRRNDCRHDQRGDSPCHEAMRGIAEEHLGVRRCPLGTQATRQVAPTPDDNHCTTTSQIAPMTVKPVGEMPSRGQGDADANPSPDPIARRDQGRRHRRERARDDRGPRYGGD